MASHLDTDGFFWRWVRATTFGWLLGLGVVIVLALAGDLLTAVAPTGAQFMVGVGIGGGVGFAQGRTLSPWLGRPGPWWVAATVGMGALFVLHDIMLAVGVRAPYSLPLYVVVGGLGCGLWQRGLLRPVSGRADWWVLGSLLGWAVPAAGVALSDWERSGFAGELVGLVTIFFGGALVGAASGGILAWILRLPAST